MFTMVWMVWWDPSLTIHMLHFYAACWCVELLRPLRWMVVVWLLYGVVWPWVHRILTVNSSHSLNLHEATSYIQLPNSWLVYILQISFFVFMVGNGWDWLLTMLGYHSWAEIGTMHTVRHSSVCLGFTESLFSRMMCLGLMIDVGPP